MNVSDDDDDDNVSLKWKMMSNILIFDEFFPLSADNIKDSSKILTKANQKCEWITINFMKFLTLGYFLGSISLAMLSAFYSYIVSGSVVNEYLYVPFKFM